LAGEIASLGCAFPDRFVVAGIIAKLPATWRDFATTLKHKREDISTEDLVITLDVEEKARAKDAPSTSAAAENGAISQILLRRNSTTRIRAKCRTMGSLRKPLTSRRRKWRRMIRSEQIMCVAKDGILQRIAATARTEMMASQTRR